MFALRGKASRYCDGVSRRSFVTAGSLAVTGLSLAEVLRAETEGTRPGPPKSVILVYLAGGISHQDTVDLKPEAPAEVRGEFKPISTNVPGIQLCELLPQLAAQADKLAIIRSLVGQRDEHASHQVLTGYPRSEALRLDRPQAGGFVSKLLGPTSPTVPASVDLFPTMQHRPYNSSAAGVLGRRYDPVRAEGSSFDAMQFSDDMARAQFVNRKNLLDSLNLVRTRLDRGQLDGFDASQKKAFDVLTTGEVVRALDVEREPAKVLERYGRGSPKHLGDGAPMWNDQLVMARRLVEAGVRLVTVAYGFWDTHGGNFAALKDRLPLFDQGISALIEDIYQRGLQDQVTVVVWGEFGRTPKINKDAGRDHWAPVNSAILSGGGLKTGQVIGSTDRMGAYAHDRPIDFRDLLATVYHQLGIDAHRLVRDQGGRPIPILPGNRQAIAELV